MAELVDAKVSKTFSSECGFESHFGHHLFFNFIYWIIAKGYYLISILSDSVMAAPQTLTLPV